MCRAKLWPSVATCDSRLKISKSISTCQFSAVCRHLPPSRPHLHAGRTTCPATLHPFKLCAAGPPPPSSMWPAPLTPFPPPPPSTLHAAKSLSPHFTPTPTPPHTHLCSCSDEVASQHSPRVSLKCAQAGTVHHTPQLQQTVTRTTQQHLRGTNSNHTTHSTQCLSSGRMHLISPLRILCLLTCMLLLPCYRLPVCNFCTELGAKEE